MRTEWRITHVAETESTNLLALSGVPGDVFTADRQTAGRGRLNHRWLSEPGMNLTMSAVVGVDGMEAEHAATLPLAAGLAVAEALSVMAGGIMLKWPNDVMAGGRKLSGILCQRNGGNAIVGIGVNVLQREWPEEIAGTAVSLSGLGCGAGVEEVRDAVLESLGNVIEDWRAGFASVYPRIAALDWLAGRRIEILQLDGAAPAAAGVCGGIREDGSLLVGGQRVWSGQAHVVAGPNMV